MHSMHSITISEDQRSMIIVALAELSIVRPGWVHALNDAALAMDNKDENGNAEMFEKLRQNHTRYLREAMTR